MADTIIDHSYAVIVAGGGGTRLWPKSRKKHPKHLLNITGEDTLIRLTFNRIKEILPVDQIFIITLPAHAPLILEQLPEFKKENMIIEPEQKNTAMAMGVASAYVHARDNEAVVINLPADHIIAKQDKFEQVMLSAFEAARLGNYLVAIGIKPTFPHTGLGYIRVGEQIGRVKVDGKDVYAFKSKGFKEKPALTTAQSFVASGQYLWNAGIYGWATKSIFEAMNTHSPRLGKEVHTILEAIGTKEETEVVAKMYSECDNESIDYAVSEKVDNLILIPGDFGWSDVGDWKVVYEIQDKDKAGNVVIPQNANYINIDSKNCLVEANGRLVVTIGLDDVVVIDTEDAVVICKKDRTQDVKKVVEKLKEDKKEEYL